MDAGRMLIAVGTGADYRRNGAKGQERNLGDCGMRIADLRFLQSEAESCDLVLSLCSRKDLDRNTVFNLYSQIRNPQSAFRNPLTLHTCFHDFQKAFRGVRQREFAAIDNAQRLFNLHPFDWHFDQLLRIDFFAH